MNQLQINSHCFVVQEYKNNMKDPVNVSRYSRMSYVLLSLKFM